jgi:1-acyl-sn-glycerol-3-phosphate acyltransferase
MIFLRSALYQFVLVVVVIPYCALVLATFPFSRLARWKVIAGWPRFALWLSRHLLGIEYEVIGRDNIPPTPTVILSKHQSAWETIAYTSIFPPHVYVLKRELFWIPFLGWGLALMSPIAIDRARGKQAMRRMIALGGERLAQGFSIMVYPEGTRIPVGRRGTYKPGGGILAVQNSVSVLPVAHNAGLVWPRNSFLKYPGKVTVVIGKPIDTHGLPVEEVMRRVEDWIEGQMLSLTPAHLPDAPNATRTAVQG